LNGKGGGGGLRRIQCKGRAETKGLFSQAGEKRSWGKGRGKKRGGGGTLKLQAKHRKLKRGKKSIKKTHLEAKKKGESEKRRERGGEGQRCGMKQEEKKLRGHTGGRRYWSGGESSSGIKNGGLMEKGKRVKKKGKKPKEGNFKECCNSMLIQYCNAK